MAHLERMHVVAVVALPEVVSFDLATPSEVFGRLALATGEPAYCLRVCGPSKRVRTFGFEIVLEHGLEAISRANTVIVAGIPAIDKPVPVPVVRALHRAKARGARIASVCTGAFVLAAAGLLDGLRATTHWLAAPELARRYPKVTVDARVLYVDNGQILTSAGAAASLDLCLHMVRSDYGASVAADAARLAVMPLEREGGQSQFVSHEPPSAQGTSLAPLLHFMERNLQHPLTLDKLARKAAMSSRSLNRHFREQTGTTPVQWLVQARVRRAQTLHEVLS